MPRQSCIDDPSIGARAKEIRDAESKVRAGCDCPVNLMGEVVHRDGCARWPGLPPSSPPQLLDGPLCLVAADAINRAVSEVVNELRDAVFWRAYLRRDEPGCNQAIAT